MSPIAIIPDPVGPDLPDLDGWRQAQKELRAKLGQDILFRIPQAKTYASDVAVDPESGEPYDPTAVPTSGGTPTEVTVKCSVFLRTIRFSGRANVEDPEFSPFGIGRNSSVALATDEENFPLIEDATEFELNGKDYRIEDIFPSGLTQTDRYIIYGEPR